MSRHHSRSSSFGFRASTDHRRHRIEPLEGRMLLSAVAVNAVPDATGVSSQLIQLAVAPQPAAAQQAGPGSFMYDGAGRVAVRVTARNVQALSPFLRLLGFKPSAASIPHHLVDGFMPLTAMTKLQNLRGHGLMGVLPIYRPVTSAGVVTSQGDNILEADRTRLATGTNGAGVTVGVISDSYNNLGGASTGVTNGDLPAGGVNVVQDLPSGGTDEGRAMLEIVHDLAPGASEAFASAFISEQQFANNIVTLAKPIASGGAGANIIVDDVSYFDEPFFQDGIVAQGVNTAVTTYGAAYFSAAANEANHSYESTNVNFISDTIPTISASAASYYNFNPTGTATDRNSFTLTSGQTLKLALQWNQPFYTVSGVTSNISFYLVNHTTGALLASATANTVANQTPFQFVSYQASGSITVDAVVRLVSGTTPTRLKWIDYGTGVTPSIATNSSTIVGHAAAANAMAVGAVNFYDNKNPESFSSQGPTTILFDAAGNPIATQIRATPGIAAIDGGDTSFFGSDVDGNGFKNFYGTSAAAPHAAAVAALLKGVSPGLTPAQIYTALKNSADPNIGGTPGNPNIVGSGLIDAYRAVVAASPTPASLPVNDGMESGYLGNAWETYNSGAGEEIVTTANTPATGSFHLIQDSNLKAPAGSFYNLPSLSEDILHVNLNGSTNAVLSFSEKAFNPSAIETNQTMPNSFTGHGNYDGVAMSVDGTTWYLVTQFLVSTTTYTSFNVNLNTIAAADGITLSSNTRIKFQHYDPRSTGAPNAGIAIDNVAVTSALNLTGTAFYLKLNADLQHLDIWTNTTGIGPTSQSLILSGISSITVTGTAGADAIVVSYAGGNPLPASGLSYDGLGAADALTVVGSSSSDTIVANATAITVGGVPVSFANTETFNIDPGAGSDSLTVNANTIHLPAQTPGGGLLTRTFSTLAVNGAGVLMVNTPASQADRTSLVVTNLSFTGAGKLDLTRNEMTVTSPAATVRGYIATTGNIFSSASGGGVGYLDVGGGNTRARFTLLGDTNLDGKVDVTDLGNLASSYGAGSGASWVQGDTNYDGKVDVTDLGNLASNYGGVLS